MLLELRVENLLLIERAELRLGPGLSVITGETGAGKTVLAHALDLLLGGRPRPGIVRPGADEAWVEGAFALPPGLLEDPELAAIADRLPKGDDEVTLARRVSAEGRSRAYIGGRAASAAELRELGGRLVAPYGQHEHRRLVLGGAQLEMLDASGGPGLLDARAAFAAAHAAAVALRRRRDELQDRAGARDRDRDLLAFELDEIDALGPDAEDRAALVTERARLREVDGLRAGAAGAAEALAPESDDVTGATVALAAAEGALAAVRGLDPALESLGERVAALRIEADDLAGELRTELEALEADPERLEAVEERIEAYARLERKHGGTVEGVLAHAERCRAELARLDGADEALAEIASALAAAEAEEDRAAALLSAGRAGAAEGLSGAVEAELSDLALSGARFSVALEPVPRRGTGDEQVEFLFAPNAGVPATPLRETASGGELSRVMLALLGVAHAGERRTLVFDEVDAGIGGQTARAVGERLRRLGAGAQVLCITHLPQIASLADRHFRIEKRTEGALARTVVEALEAGEVVDELCRMLGADAADDGARRHAHALLAAA